MKGTHAEAIDYLVARLEKKGRDCITEVLVYDDQRVLRSDADVLHSAIRDGVIFITRYEVKACHGRRKAREQARTWFDLYSFMPNIRARFVFYNARYDYVERWRPEDVYSQKKGTNDNHGAPKAGLNTSGSEQSDHAAQKARTYSTDIRSL